MSFSPYEYNDNKSVITVRGSVTNNTTAAVTVNDNDVPNFSGLDTRGESIIIELYGKWDWTPPPGNARANSIALPPGQQLTYTVSSTQYNSPINDVKYWFTTAALGSMEAVFDFNGPYWDCPRPLRSPGTRIISSYSMPGSAAATRSAEPSRNLRAGCPDWAVSFGAVGA